MKKFPGIKTPYKVHGFNKKQQKIKFCTLLTPEQHEEFSQICQK